MFGFCTTIEAIKWLQGKFEISSTLSTYHKTDSILYRKLLDDGFLCLLDENEYNRTHWGAICYSEFINYINHKSILGKELLLWYKELPCDIDFIYVRETIYDDVPF